MPDSQDSSHKDRHQHAAPSPRANQTKATKSPSKSPPQTPSIEVVPPFHTYTPSESCSTSSSWETPERMLSIDRALSPFSRQPSPLPSPRSPRFQTSSASKTRMIGLSHWMAPCNEMDVVRAMLDHSEPFNPCRKAFRELKTMLRLHNSVPPSLPTLTSDTDLKLLLPVRPICKRWCAQYQATYGRIYSILDPKALGTDVDRIYTGTLSHPVHVSKVLLAIAIAMQPSSSSDRLYGRTLARQVEIFLHSSSRFQKPCIGVVQVHLLLIVLKTISASDTDKFYDLMGLHGITTQIVLNMGLHRDPALFADVSPYHAEVRKRLWATFVRLNLDYCVRSGTHFTLRLEESDCPLPTTAGLRAPTDSTTTILGREPDEQARTDLDFGIAAARLANVIGPMQQALYSSKAGEASDPCQLQNELRAAYEDIIASLPVAELQRGPGSGSPRLSSTDPMQSLQQSILSITFHSFLSIINLASTLGCPPHSTQRPSLIEIWDYSTSVFHEFRSLCQSSSPVPAADIACHLLWTDACRAVLAACWAVSRLRELNFSISPHPQQSTTMVHMHVFQQILTDALGFLSGMWKGKFHLGPVAAKTSLILAVTLNVTLAAQQQNSSSSSNLDVAPALMEVGVVTAEMLIGEFTAALQQQQQQQQQQQSRQPTSCKLPDLSSLGIMTSVYSPSVISGTSLSMSPLSDADMEEESTISMSMPVTMAGTGTGTSIYASWPPPCHPAPTSSSSSSCCTSSSSTNTLLVVPPTNSSGASSLVSTPSLTTSTHEYDEYEYEYFDLHQFSAAAPEATAPGFSCIELPLDGHHHGYDDFHIINNGTAGASIQHQQQQQQQQQTQKGMQHEGGLGIYPSLNLDAYQQGMVGSRMGLNGMDDGMSLWQ
ncbi:hypothetical protein GE21DRAFT_6967 [Neurospora crassa]|uniref:Xylanolytic transcriptional activator regulatory domain-containing protein n=1 Tax=Neurospora crassa (strain ATCC 24698 / 74-OR23-1A / CBS 708.71 / DSM 1257 / FGSC 987) TaxID=367110 RepID=Q1K692_NEUCR|nr:hypothetical protein NCU08901 [Neurospora crassa OR74A]EAA29603.2 hypothetical protein NCU08901 [Neurospora crassa OR74A]KHE81100.1 hypothetical protein GE21DRAFT_6967 [Neurospora crassa]|eukprot:XP_958839.2 hypothetical protein NCU08901 [Neurospora crassa OR74A]